MSVSTAPLRTEDGAPGKSVFPAHPDLDAAITRSQSYLLSEQKSEGYWVGELMVDVTLVADMVAFYHWWGKVDPVWTRPSRCSFRHTSKHPPLRRVSSTCWRLLMPWMDSRST